MDIHPLGLIVSNAYFGGRYGCSRQLYVGGEALGGVGPRWMRADPRKQSDKPMLAQLGHGAPRREVQLLPPTPLPLQPKRQS